jgi:transposase
LCKVAGRQLIRPGFGPPPAVRKLRDLTRYRAGLVAARAAEKNRAGKLRQDARIKLPVVVSGIFGACGRDTLAALAAGRRSPGVLAQPARRSTRPKITGPAEARAGSLTAHHAFGPGTMLTRAEAITGEIAALDARIEAGIAPFAAAVRTLDEVPGINPAAAHAIIAETGLDMARFPTAGHLVPGAGYAPGDRAGGRRWCCCPRRACRCPRSPGWRSPAKTGSGT